MLSMKPAEFRALVEEGALPRPRDIGGLKRWDVEELSRVIRGEAAEGMGDVSW
jgi:predicted DNA-binding transcriptional regulator AlpA